MPLENQEPIGIKVVPRVFSSFREDSFFVFDQKIRGCILYNFGMMLFVLGMLVVFGADRLFKKGKIEDLKTLLKIKSAGLGLTVLGMIIMIYNYR